jgi:hypothetical protein
MKAIFFNELKDLGLDYVKLVSDDFLLKDKFENYELLADEEAFVEPFLIAHYHQPSRKESQSLNQLLLGFMEKGKEPSKIEVRTDACGAIYLPQIGYLVTKFPHATFTLNISSESSGKKYTLDLSGKNIPFEFEELRYVPNSNIEIFRYSHEYIIHKLGHDEHITDVHLETEPNEIVDKYSKTMINAFEIIRKVDPLQFEELNELTKKIAFFRADRFVNFTSMDVQGIIFISTYDSAKELTFMDTLIHECSHLSLNLILFNLEDFFTIDPFELKFRSPFRTILRGLYQSLHATYVLAKLVRFYNKCYKAKVFSGIQEYELIGLFLLDMKLLGESLDYIGDRSDYTEAGWNIVEEINKVYHTIYKEQEMLIKKYKVPGEDRDAAVVPKDFEVDAFLEVNNLSRAELGLVD